MYVLWRACCATKHVRIKWLRETSTRGHGIRIHHQNSLCCWRAFYLYCRKKMWTEPASCDPEVVCSQKKASRNTTKPAIIDYVARSLHLQSPCEDSKISPAWPLCEHTDNTISFESEESFCDCLKDPIQSICVTVRAQLHGACNVPLNCWR